MKKKEDKKFSIIIPVAPNRSAPMVESIKRLNYPKSNFEVIIVKGTNPSKNRNNGFEKSKGEYVIFLDDDGIVEENYLRNLENFFNSHPEIDIVGGPQLTPKNERGFAKISGYALSSKFGAANVSDRYKKKLNLNADECSITSANLACRKKVMEKVKFDIRLFPGEDPKFIEDARKLDFKVASSPDFVIYHKRRANAQGLIRQIFNYGKVRPFKEKFTSTLKRPFFLIPSLFVIYLFFIFVYILLNPIITGGVINSSIYSQTNLLFLPLLAYMFLNIIFSLYESLKNRDFKAIFVLPIIYLMIHLSYGLGMIYGYLRKLK